jgi:hypothetical protein
MTRHHRADQHVRCRAAHSGGGCGPLRPIAASVRGTLPAFLFAMVLLIAQQGAMLAVADDQVDDLDRELLDALEGKPPKDSPFQIIPRLLDTTRTAASRLEGGQLDQQIEQLQTQILADIDALLEQAAPPPPQSRDASQLQSQQQQQQQTSQSQDQQDSQPEQENDADPNAASEESEERTARGEQTAAERERRLGLSTAAWGHLPPKVREQMRSAFSEEYLPQYDALVRQYYEALARRRADQR